MKKYLSPSPSVKSTSFFTRNKKCDCDCHSPESNITDYLARSDRDKICYYPTSPMTQSSKTAMDSCVCVCEKVCECPCHCVSCVCCPCIKDREKIDKDSSDCYKNLYFQIKNELDLEKKRNERMKYNKTMQEDNIENIQKENKLLLEEIDQLKQKLAETMNELNENRCKNIQNFTKNEGFCCCACCVHEDLSTIKDAYEKMIEKNKR